MLLDIHSHRTPPYPEGLVSSEAGDFREIPGQLYSLGVHPWNLGATPQQVEAQCDMLAEAAAASSVAAIGEAGFDTVRGGAMMLQTLAFRRQVDLSEQLRKPLVVHCVKSIDMVVGWRRRSGAVQPWIVHGFRGKPQAAAMLLKAGCRLSFGPLFNEETLRGVPAEMLFAETDESPLPIGDVIAKLSEVRDEDVHAIVADNMRRLFDGIDF